MAQQDQAILEQQQALREYFPERRPVITALDIVRPYLDAASTATGSFPRK